LADRGTPKDVFSEEEAYPFTTNALCALTGLKLDKGVTYRLRLTILKSIPWTDNGILANGIRPQHVPITMTIGVPLRRYLSQSWFRPIPHRGKRNR
jgi:hypothetical protein